MKIFKILTLLFVGVLSTACSDDPVQLRLHDMQGEYTVNGGLRLDATVNGAAITLDGSKIKVSMTGDKIASLTIEKIIPGHGELTIGGFEISQSTDGNGIVFGGKIAISETEMLIISGQLVQGKLTIDLRTVPLTE